MLGSWRTPGRSRATGPAHLWRYLAFAQRQRATAARIKEHRGDGGTAVFGDVWRGEGLVLWCPAIGRGLF